MGVEVRMPRLSDSMEEGTILGWLVRDGEEATLGQDLLEIESDKATIAYEAPASGVLHVIARDGDTVSVGQVIATIGAEPVGGLTPSVSAASAGPAEQTAVSASPVARRTAEEYGIDLSNVAGSGPGGRISKEDVLAARVHASPTTPAAPASLAPTTSGNVRHPLTRTQQLVARRVTEAKATIPEFSVAAWINMDAALRLRDRLREADGPAPTINDFVIAATGRALRSHPYLNASVSGDAYELHKRVNVGIVVAVEHELLIPTLTDADQRSLSDLATESRRLVERTRAGTITPSELSGGTFTVTNLGMFGITSFTPIINLPQVAILAVGCVSKGEMNVTLVSDHRIVYGAQAGAFLRDLRTLLEDPDPNLL